ncbi:MAG: Asp-tRNA(Asn)/Glu-tRNA(Gln) amidotransferase GatCAB subunit A, partial [Chloroflexi bacterium]|nr:Asp-tRNA(Asn)/Glu-tRNA(Gln) amidotransferase GatCAB subunit A [Chloroflexota bacterium]
MTAAEPLYYRSIGELAPLLKSRQLSPVELTRGFLDRIDALDHRVHAYITVTADRALADAQAAADAIGRGDYRGPLHGIPIALKDLLVTGGIRTTAHSQLLAGWVPAADGAIAARLREAGTVLLGKLALSEFAYGDSNPAIAPPARNPWDLERAPGFSSSGSGAAVAAGLCAASVGSDTGGSIRQPAALCGIVGLKPTYGRVTRRGGLPLAWSLDHFGPLTRTVEDAALVLQALAGHDPEDPTSSPAAVPDYRAALEPAPRGLRVGVPRAFFFDRGPEVDPQAVDAVEAGLRLLERLGVQLEEVHIPSLPYCRAAQSLILMTEARAYHARTLRDRPQDLGPLLRHRLRLAGFYRASD